MSNRRDEVRAAAARLHAAIDRHLSAVEATADTATDGVRAGDTEPSVLGAYRELAEAADAYDDALYDVYDEVTPFDVTLDEDTEVAAQRVGEPDALTLLVRADVVVRDRAGLLAAARATAGEWSDDDLGTVSEALDELLGARGPLLFGEAVVGLDPVGTELLVLPTGTSLADGPPDDDPAAAFEAALAQRPLHRRTESYG